MCAIRNRTPLTLLALLSFGIIPSVLWGAAITGSRFQKSVSYPCPNPIALATGDFNGDGHPDLVVVSRWSTNHEPKITFLYGKGDGTFKVAAQPFQDGRFDEVSVVNLGGAGSRDLVLQGNRNHLQFFQASGNGEYARIGSGRPFIPIGINSFALGNFYGAEGLDVAAVSEDRISVFEGLREPALRHVLKSELKVDTRGSCIISADVDGDGMSDLIVAHAERDYVTVLLNGKTEPFTRRKTFQVGSGVWSMAAADLNGDGKTDLVGVHRGSDVVSIALGNGDGTFGARRVLSVGNLPTRAYIADVNGDGKPDLLSLNEASGDVSILIGKGNGQFASAESIQVGRMPSQAVVADFNLDGKPDLACANSGDNSVAIFLNASDGVGALPSLSQTNGSKTLPISAAPFQPFTGEDEVRAWSTEDGLPRNALNCVYQAPNGFIWIGTQEAIVRFDGKSFLRFRLDGGCSQMCADKEGRVFAVGGKGLFRLESGKFVNIPAAPQGRLHRLCTAKGGGIYFSSPHALYEYRAGQVTTVTNMFGLVGDVGPEDWWFHALAEDAEGHLWCSWNDLLFRRDSVSGQFQLVFKGLGMPWEKEGVSTLQPLDDGSVWFGTSQGLWCWKNGRIESHSRAGGLLSLPIKSLCKDGESGLWIGTGDRRIHHLVAGQMSSFSLEAGLEAEGIRSLFGDREGNVWAATDSGGLKFLRPRAFRTITAKDGLAFNDVRSICEGTNGEVLVATDLGYSILKNGGVSADAKHNYRRIFVDSMGTTWLGGDPGLYFLKSGMPVRVRFGDQPKEAFERINSIYEDKQHRLWVAGLPGLYCRSNGVWQTVRPPDKRYPWKHLSGVLEDSVGNMWVGSLGSGLTCIHQGEFSLFTKTNGLLENSISPVRVDSNGAVWFVSGAGLVRYKNGAFKTISTREGLKETISFNILVDDYGWAWLNGMRGIYRVRKEDLDAVADGKQARVQPIRYGTADGIVSVENNGTTFPNSVKTRDGRLWFPTTKGLVTVDPKQLRSTEQPPPITIEQVQADERTIYSGDQLTTDRRNKRETISRGSAKALQFRFAAPEFGSPERVHFRYRLNKHDADWIDAGMQRYALYTHLKPGDYLFEVTAEGLHGLSNQAPATYSFAIAPFFYQTTWFLALCLGGASGMLYGLHTLRMHFIKRIERLQAQHALGLERARIARNMHDELGASLTKIKLLSDLAEGVKDLPPEVRDQFHRISSTAQGVSREMDEIVWTVNPENDTLDRLVDYITNFAEEFLRLANLRLRLKVSAIDQDIKLVSELRHDMLMVVKESLNNVVKHAHASEVSLAVAFENGLLRVCISDDGKGFDVAGANGTRNGLSNMRDRIEKLRGNFGIESKPKCGTIVRFAIPLSCKNYHHQ
ncbi:MAG: hypothetical protein JWM16_5840 [Verrucomicrobiales bacterium]|nr:hypothetical protein [Verrucomicrobiales bacterium]